MTRKSQDMEKIAVDQTTIEYYTEYFKDYGKQWVRDIPRKIHARIASIIRTASDNGQVGLELLGRQYPLYGRQLVDGGLIIEGVFRGQGKLDEQTFPVARMFVASFDADGNVIKFEDTDLSAVLQAA